MRSGLFIDSWGWIVLANRGEDSFETVSRFYQQEVSAGTVIVTTDYVLDEVITFLFPRMPNKLATKYLQGLIGSVAGGQIRLERIGNDRFEKAWRMRLKYVDHPKISFTDLASFVVMQEISVSRALTNDQHFEQVNLGFLKYPTLPGPAS